MVVVELVVVLVVVATSFITESEASKEAFKTATLLKTIAVNSLIIGEIGVGKKTLAQYILPNAQIIDALNIDELLTNIENSKEIIINNLEKSSNLKIVLDAINSNNIKVVATTNRTLKEESLDDTFSVKFTVPPLIERDEDVVSLIDIFSEEASALFGTDSEFNSKGLVPDLSENSISLKRQIMIKTLLHNIKDVELMDIIEHYLYDKLGSNSDYRDFLYLYEVPLIKSGLKKFKSQLQLSDKLGLNRNTLRKKIADNKKYL